MLKNRSQLFGVIFIFPEILYFPLVFDIILVTFDNNTDSSEVYKGALHFH